jgi:hypothetical protein
MRNLKIIIITGLCLICLQSLGQGVPKAYEVINYQGKANGRLMKFMLANGYIGASTLEIAAFGKSKPRLFEPEAGVADEHNQLKFKAANPNNQEYFIIDNMQEAYEETPRSISGMYFLNGKKKTVKLELVRGRKR